jgi:hypothetical protein
VGLDELIARSDIWRGTGRYSPRATVTTGFEALDRLLPGGGWPRSGLSEIFVERYGIGELALLMPVLRQLLSEQGRIVWIAPPFTPYAPALSAHGIDLAKVLVVEPVSDDTDRLWAIEQVLRSGCCDGLLAWLEVVPEKALRRLQIAAEAQHCVTALFRPVAAMHGSSPAVLRMQLVRENSLTRARIIKCRGARPAIVDLSTTESSGGAVRTHDGGAA